MAVYNYIAYDDSGKEHKGVLEGDTPRKIRQILREKALTPVDIKRTSERASLSMLGGHPWFKRINSTDLALFTREIATLLAAAMPVEEALLAVSEQTEKAHFKEIILAVRARVLEGYTFAKGLADFPRLFPQVYCATVAAGEQSGHLHVVLNHLADYTERQQHIRQKTKQALIYPSIMIVVSVLIVGFLLVLVVPKMITVFEDTGQQLPYLTRVLLGISTNLQSFGGYGVGVLFFGAFLFKRGLRNQSFRERFHLQLLKIPVIGKSIRVVNTARFSRTLGI